MLFVQAYSRDSSFGTMTKLYLDDRRIGVQFPAVARDFLFSKASFPAAGPSQSHTEWVGAAHFSRVKQPQREAHSSPSSSAQVKNECSYNLLLLYVFMTCTQTTVHIGLTFTYFLTPWSRVLLEKLTGSQIVKKIPAFYVTWRFITAFTSACHLSLS